VGQKWRRDAGTDVVLHVRAAVSAGKHFQKTNSPKLTQTIVNIIAQVSFDYNMPLEKYDYSMPFEND